MNAGDIFEHPVKNTGKIESLKSSGRTGLCDIVSIQRSAWCYAQNIDILEYSFQNGGGREAKRLAIVNNYKFQTFRKEKCEMEK